MRTICKSFTLLLAVTGLSAGNPAAAQIVSPPKSLKLDPFYKQAIRASGMWITASDATPPEALERAKEIVDDLLVFRPDIARSLVAVGQRYAVMAQTESTLDLPEQRDWKKPRRDAVQLTYCERKHYDTRIAPLSDYEYWAKRARGMGGFLASGAAENLLGVPGTRYYGENIFAHEASHTVFRALGVVSPKERTLVEIAYANAKAKGLWKGEYAENTIDEYWAEGTQFWFNNNYPAVVNGVVIRNDEDFARHDPALAAVMAKVYGADHHRLKGDIYWKFSATTPAEALPQSTAEQC
ncbi:MAG: glycoside hydrolase [Sphingobium sp.]|nr:glycoside hydrolase [Sphingobium sp.]